VSKILRRVKTTQPGVSKTLRRAKMTRQRVSKTLRKVKMTRQRVSKTLRRVKKTQARAAEILKVSLVTLSDWNKKKILNPYRLGNLIRYKRSEIEQALISINAKKL